MKQATWNELKPGKNEVRRSLPSFVGNSCLGTGQTTSQIATSCPLQWPARMPRLHTRSFRWRPLVPVGSCSRRKVLLHFGLAERAILAILKNSVRLDGSWALADSPGVKGSPIARRIAGMSCTAVGMSHPFLCVSCWKPRLINPPQRFPKVVCMLIHGCLSVFGHVQA